jgi:5-methylcytosine-specific restriction protein A
LGLLLSRLKEIQAVITDILVESKETASLASENRRINPKNYNFPILTGSVAEISDLRKAISSAQGKVGRAPGAKGPGNPTRRIRIYFTSNTLPGVAESQLAAFLCSGDWKVLPSVGRFPDPIEPGVDGDMFNAANIQDARNKINRAIALRQGQPAFRKSLLQVYGGKCAITGSDAEAALEAAHILPYRGPLTHHVQNGLLLGLPPNLSTK